MPEEAEREQVVQVNRVYEQPPDAVTCYCEIAHITGTGHEVVMQFYETVPGPPSAGGKIQMVRSRLRATVVVNKAHAVNIGRLLLKQTGEQG